MKTYTERISKNIYVIVGIGIILFIVSLAFFSSIAPNRKIYSQNDPHVKNDAYGIAEKCKNENRAKCYEESFTKLVGSIDFSFGEQTLYALQDIDPASRSCHVIAHKMAEKAVEKDPADWLYFLDNVDVNACGGGFLHGVLEAHIEQNPGLEVTSELSDEICLRGNDPYRQRMCTHLMGHIFVVDSLDKIDKAVPVCDGVRPNLKFDCLDGVFMEHAQKIELSDHNFVPDVVYTPEYIKSLENICYKYKGVQASACWTEMAEVYAKTFGYIAQTVYDHCYNQTAGEANAHSCYMKGVVILATYPYDVTTPKLVSICAMYDKDSEYKTCVSNLMASLMYYSVKYTDRGIDYCNNASGDKLWCFSALGRQLKQFAKSESDRKSLCANAPDEYKNACAAT